MSKKAAARNARVLENIRRILATPHHPSVCPAKGMFGRDCANCDRDIPASAREGTRR